MEGVMMKARNKIATAVRTPKGEISVRQRTHTSFAERSGLQRVPFVRGVFILIDTVVIGLQELHWSTNESIGEEEEKLSQWELTITIIFSLLLALGLFKLLPLYLASVLTQVIGAGNWTLNLADGVLKIGLFILYIGCISLMSDVKRLFQYHGAEHKAVNCYEAGKKLTPRNAQTFTLLQPRCGTTFVMYVFVLSIFLYVLIPFNTSLWLKFLGRIALLPVVAGISYEWIRFSGSHYSSSIIVRVLATPGLWMQRLTTKQPDTKQLAVAIAALKKVIPSKT